MFRLDGRTALITGAGRGMGLGIARSLGHQGARLLINDLFPDRAEEACQALRDEGLEAVTAAFDITDYGAVCEAVESLGMRDREGWTGASRPSVTGFSLAVPVARQ